MVSVGSMLLMLVIDLWQEEMEWEPVVHDHRGEEIALFVLGTAIVAAIVIVRRIMRRERSARRRMLE